jgi:hypothetical protein
MPTARFVPKGARHSALRFTSGATARCQLWVVTWRLSLPCPLALPLGAVGIRLAHRWDMMSKSPRPTSRRCPERSLERDTAGLVFVEYIILVAFVGIVLAAGLFTLGPQIIAEYSDSRATLYSHSP